MNWLCRMIGHRWVTWRKFRIDDVRCEQQTIWPSCLRCGEPSPDFGDVTMEEATNGKA
jgi:hypothetical protein